MTSTPIPKNDTGANLREIASTLLHLASLQQELTGKTDDQLRSYAQNVSLGLFRLVVMGEIKKGKSAFINALLRSENLVPVHSDVATSTIYKIRFGKEVTYTVYFNQKDSAEPLRKQLISPQDLRTPDIG
ncbi:MAG: dynamin family protein [Candidatus Tectomicrobia bacterium]|nr:dynamin family protein [Candidatus Tectomicrobia bacterium]